MQPHQQKVLKEKVELDGKIAKLEAFFDAPAFRELSAIEQAQLHDQVQVMHSYSGILERRIAGFV